MIIQKLDSFAGHSLCVIQIDPRHLEYLRQLKNCKPIEALRIAFSIRWRERST